MCLFVCHTRGFHHTSIHTCYVQKSTGERLTPRLVFFLFGGKKARLVVVVHVHCGLQGFVHLCLREDDVAGQTADTTDPIADGHLVDTRHTAAVGADAACVAHSVTVLELLGWRKIQAGEGTRLA